MTMIHYSNGESGEYENVIIRESGWVEAHREGRVVHLPAGQIREIDGEVSCA